MHSKDKVLNCKRLYNRLKLMRQVDPALFETGPLSYLYDRLQRENESDYLALLDESVRESMQDLILRLVSVFENMAEQEHARQEEETRKLVNEIGELESQLRQEKDKNANMRAQLSFVRSHLHQVMEEFESLISNTDKLYEALMVVCDLIENGLETYKPKRYRYNIEVIKIAILTIVHARCSFRSAVGVLEIFAKYLPFLFPDGVPAYTTVRYWVIKSGLALAPLLKKRITGKYILIVDESIVLNKQKMLVILAAPLSRERGKALSFKDVSIAHMEMSESWKNEDISDRLKKVADEMGGPPEYVLSDDGTNLKSAVRNLGWNRHRDIGHAIATMLEDTFDNDDRFKEFKKTLGSLKNLTLAAAAPFAPPKERSQARWLNIAPSVKWALWIMDVNSLMDDNVRRKFEELCSKHPGIVTELKLVTDCVNDILKSMKTRGLSRQTVREAKALLDKLPRHFRGTIIMRDKINAYLEEECALLKDETDCHPISSDIIESYFSVVKRIMPNAKFYGFTEYSLAMYTRVFLDSPDGLDKLDMLKLMGATSMKDIESWCQNNLVESAYDRKKAFIEKVKESRKPKKAQKSA